MPILELVNELVSLENRGPVCGGTAGESRDAAVNGVGCQVVPDTSLYIRDAQNVAGRTGCPWRSGSAADSLTRATSADLRILEDSDQVLQVVSRPENVVVSPDNDAGLDVLKGSHHLCPLTKTGNAKDLDMAEVVGIAERTAGRNIRVQDHNEDGTRSTGSNTSNALSELGRVLEHGGYNDARVGWSVVR